jgi:hypothetical protein
MRVNKNPKSSYQIKTLEQLLGQVSTYGEVIFRFNDILYHIKKVKTIE